MRKSREELTRMGSEELKEILRLDSQGVEEYPTEDILYMLDLLGQREEEKGEVHVDVEAAWRRFQRDYLQRKEEPQAPVYTPKVRRWQRLPRGLGATAAALVLAFVGMLTAYAAGWGGWGEVVPWEAGIYILTGDGPVTSVTTTPEQGPVPEGVISEVLAYGDFQTALDDNGVTEVRAPTWLPKGCQFQTAQRIFRTNPTSFQLYAEYADQETVWTIRVMPAGSTNLEELSASAEPTQLHGQTAYITQDDRTYTVFWETQDYQYFVSGPDREAVEQMAGSMVNQGS